MLTLTFLKIRYERGHSHTATANFCWRSAHTSATPVGPIHFLNRADWCSKPSGQQTTCVGGTRTHYPITRIKLAVGPTANKSCIVYGGLRVQIASFSGWSEAELGISCVEGQDTFLSTITHSFYDFICDSGCPAVPRHVGRNTYHCSA